MEDWVMRSLFFRRFVAVLLVLVCCLPAGIGQGETYPFMAYTTANLRLRQLPSDSGTVLRTIPKGDAVLVTGESGGYYIVTYEGTQGYAMKQYLAYMEASAPLPVVTPAAEQTSSAYSVLYAGSEGTAVRTLQEALKELGFYTASVDGKFGTGTKNAVSAFQKMNSLPQTGAADAATQALLYDGTPKNSKGKTTSVKTLSPVAGAVISSGSRGDAVSTLQTRLRELGYYKGTVDGVCGSGTVSAIQAFQKKNGLSVTGKADAATQAALYAPNAISAKATATPRPTATPTPAPTSVPGATSAPTFPFITYTLTAVNLRKGPSTDTVRLLTIPKGAEITVLALSGDYLNVVYGGQTGYIVSQYAQIPAQYLPGSSLKTDSAAQENYPYLQSGATGKNVAVLQEALKELEFYSGALDGAFGASTVAALKAFQKKNNLKQDGVASPEVQKLIFEGRPLNARGKKTDVKILPLISGVEMKLNDKGDAVTDLQNRLRSLGFYTGASTGVYDSATQKAVKKFQQGHNLYVDGVAGKKTQLLLYALTATPTPAPIIWSTYQPVTPQPTNTPLTAQNVIVMQNGTRGLAVRQLQERLMELGYYTCTADAVYDSDEMAAVREFQRKNGLKIDGIAGLQTQLVLFSDAALPATTAALPTPTPTPTPYIYIPPYILPTATAPATAVPFYPPVPLPEVLRIGSKGDSVSALQSRLSELGYYSGAIDGLFGTGTAQAVTRFQRANRLTADGVAGQETLNQLYSGNNVVLATATPKPTATPTPAATVLKAGDQGAEVKAMQQRLVALGYLAAADGIYGPRTYNAVVAFQKRNGLTSDGIAGKLTLNRLNSSSAVAAQTSIAVQNTVSSAVQTSSASFKAPSASEVRYANWYTEIRARARLMPDVIIYDPDSGLHFNMHLFSFGKHADGETPTAEDTEILYRINGENNWTPKYVWVIFSDGRVYIGSTHSHGHEVDHTPNNGLNGHICLHFPRIMSEAEATGPYAVSHQKEILWGWELTQAKTL